MKRTAILLAPTLAALTLATPAHADPEQDFCQYMAYQGYGGDCALASAVSHGQCAQFASGRSMDEVIDSGTNLTGSQDLSIVLISAAVSFYCPEYSPI